ncbi:MAG: transposase, partial [Syntrophales bacterium LBB04]|nr:transposase [Syntrophales bacterium LBB04]
KKRCPACDSYNVKLDGKTSSLKQRFQCKHCQKRFVWRNKHNKRLKEKRWFDLWITEGYSVRQLSKLSGHSPAKIKRIKNYWLNQDPPALCHNDHCNVHYLLFDGTYFHEDGCLAIFTDAQRRVPIFWAYIDRESYESVHPLIVQLKEQGLDPKAITLDGHRMVIRAILQVWPDVLIQRCLFHIQNQGLMWIRSFPKTIAGQELQILLKGLTKIRSTQDQRDFQRAYSHWRSKYRGMIALLPKESVANKDLQRTMRLIDNAEENMFHFIKDRNIEPTTNILESFYSRLKHHYRSHRGLTTKHKIAFLNWFCYLKSV